MNKFQITVHDNNKIFDFNFGIVDFIRSKGFELSVSYKDIYSLLDWYPNGMVQNFLHSYEQNKNRDTCKIKYLADCFLHMNPKTVFSVYEKSNKLVLSKGSKKVFACAVANNLNHITLMITKNVDSNIINTDQELYIILKALDPKAKTFRIVINVIDEIPNIHFCENVKTYTNYFRYTNQISKLSSVRIRAKHKILLVNNAQCFDPSLNYDYIKFPINDRSDFYDLIKKYNKYRSIIVADQPVEVTKEYLNFIQVDFFKKEKNKFCIGNKVLIYNRFKFGILNKIADPPTPASNGNNLTRYV